MITNKIYSITARSFLFSKASQGVKSCSLVSIIGAIFIIVLMGITNHIIASTFYIDGDGINDPPVAQTDKYKGYEDNIIQGNILKNDYDSEGDSIILDTIPLIYPLNGSISIVQDGSFTYTPDTGFIGTDSSWYLIYDDAMPSLSDTGLLIIIVLPAPITNTTVANDDQFAHTYNTSIINNVLNNDYDPEGDSQFASLLTPPSHGYLQLNMDGSFIYIHDNLYCGSDQFTYVACDDNVQTACDTAVVYIVCYILPVFTHPKAVDDDFIMAAGTSASIPVLGNDIPITAPLDVSSLKIYGPPVNGLASIDSVKAEVTYQAFSPSYTGTDSFYYQVCNVQGLCDTAMVRVNIISSSPTISLSGSVSYNSTYKQALVGISINVLDTTGNLLASGLTDSCGYYGFNNLNPGYYRVEAYCSNQGGGYNAIDAMLSLQHFAHLRTLPPLARKAADVDANGIINSADALMIGYQFAQTLNSFPAGQWIFEEKTILIPAVGKFLCNIKGQCIGDVNGSFK